MRIDLHTHSTCSDGTDTPRQLMQAARQAQLTVLGLTDHDTVEGWEEAASEVSTSAIELVRGAEFSTAYRGITAHILGYLFNPQDETIQSLFRQVKESRYRRLQAMVERLQTTYPISWSEVLAQTSPGVAVGRPHLADALIARGYFQNRNQVFAQLLNTASPYYVRYTAVPSLQAIRAIRQAGGVAVFAHPRAKTRQRRFVSAAGIQAMRQAGLSALEVKHPEQDPLAQAEVAQLAKTYGLAQTGASDYHGRGKPNRLGQELTDPLVYRQLFKHTYLPILSP